MSSFISSVSPLSLTRQSHEQLVQALGGGDHIANLLRYMIGGASPSFFMKNVFEMCCPFASARFYSRSTEDN